MNFDRSAAEARFARRLLPIARRWRTAADSALAALGLSNANGWVVLQIARMNEGVRQGALAEELDISGASLVRLLDQLERTGLVVRTADAGDRRTNRLSLTEKGRALADEIEGAFAALRATLLADVNDADLAAVNAVLDRIDARIAGERENRR